LAKVFGGNLTLQTASEYAQQANNVPAWLIPLISKIALIALIASIAYLLFRVIHYFVDTHKKNQRTKLEVETQTDVNRKDLVWKK